MVNINSLLNGERIEYSKTWDYKNVTYQLYITAKHLYWYAIYNDQKPHFSINTRDLDMYIGTHLGTGGIMTAPPEKFVVYLLDSKDKCCSFDFPGTAEGLQTAEEVYQAITKAKNGLK